MATVHALRQAGSLANHKASMETGLSRQTDATGVDHGGCQARVAESTCFCAHSLCQVSVFLTQSSATCPFSADSPWQQVLAICFAFDESSVNLSGAPAFHR